MFLMYKSKNRNKVVKINLCMCVCVCVFRDIVSIIDNMKIRASIS